MQTAISRLTRKNQATIPAAVRRRLNLKAGDAIVFEIDNETVTVRKAKPMDMEFLPALVPTLSEWGSKNDEEAFNDV